VGGKSELHRTGCRVTPGGHKNNFMIIDSATENKLPREIIIPWLGEILVKFISRGKGEKVGKEPTGLLVTTGAR